MVEVQIGSLQLPILITPRINGVPVTQTQIKNDFSNKFVSDIATPIAWTLETRTRTGTVQLLVWNEGNSTDSVIFFQPLDSFYAVEETYTIIPFWTIDTEKIYGQESIQFKVKQLHDGV